MTKNKQQPPKENNTNMPNNKEVNQIKELKVKYLPEKENEYGSNHLFHVLDETPLKELIDLSDMKKTIWEYNGKY